MCVPIDWIRPVFFSGEPDKSVMRLVLIAFLRGRGITQESTAETPNRTTIKLRRLSEPELTLPSEAMRLVYSSKLENKYPFELFDNSQNYDFLH